MNRALHLRWAELRHQGWKAGLQFCFHAGRQRCQKVHFRIADPWVGQGSIVILQLDATPRETGEIEAFTPCSVNVA